MLNLTLIEVKAQKSKVLTELIGIAGSPNHLATMLGINPNVIKGWITRGQVSKLGVELIENHTVLGRQFNMSNLRPELKSKITD